MSKKLWLPPLLLVLSLNLSAFRQGTDDSSTMNECLWNQESLGKDKVECNDVYHHYLPHSSKKDKVETARIGSYNILRMSEQKGKKDLDLTARMIDTEWDMMALQELQPGRTDELREFGKTGVYSHPAYLQLLLKLQELDPTWGMILTPYSQGADSELLGFIYRGSKVEPVESEYCKKHFVDNPPYQDKFVYRELTTNGFANGTKKPVNDRAFVVPDKAIACNIQVSPMALNYFVKVPLTARFKIGSFESSFISLHLSFRGIDEFDSSCMGLCQIQNIKLISTLDGDENNPIVQKVNETLESRDFKNLVAGTEVKVADPEDRCRLDEKRLAQDEDKANKLFENCLKNLQNQMDLIKEKGFLPPSCENVVAKIDDEALYTKCQEDYEDLRDKAYKTFISNFFKNQIFGSGGFERVKKDKGESMADWLTGIFATGTSHGAFNFLGKDNQISKGEGREFARLYQVYVVMKAAEAIRNEESSKDVIISGDFNLEKETDDGKWDYHLWHNFLEILGDAGLLIEGPTSINDKRELASNYDHFIFSLSETNECDPESASVLNFLTATLSDGFELGAKVAELELPFVMSDHLPVGIQCSTK